MSLRLLVHICNLMELSKTLSCVLLQFNCDRFNPCTWLTYEKKYNERVLLCSWRLCKSLFLYLILLHTPSLQVFSILMWSKNRAVWTGIEMTWVQNKKKVFKEKLKMHHHSFIYFNGTAGVNFFTAVHHLGYREVLKFLPWIDIFSGL